METELSLIRISKPRVRHLFSGKDTICKMYSTGGLKPTKYVLVKTEDYKNLSICNMCLNNSKKDGKPKKKIPFWFFKKKQS